MTQIFVVVVFVSCSQEIERDEEDPDEDDERGKETVR